MAYKFKNNFNKIESSRFDVSVELLSMLFKNDNHVTDKINSNQLKQVQVLPKGDRIYGATDALVSNITEEDMASGEIYLQEFDLNNQDFSFATTVHELVHFLGDRTDEEIDNMLETNLDEVSVKSPIITNIKTGKNYGKAWRELGADLISDMAVATNHKNTKIDEVFKNNLTFRPEGYTYRPLSSIASLMTIAMNNDFSGESYHEKAIEGSGIIDGSVELRSAQGQKTVPTNDFLYGIVMDGMHLKDSFDEYTNVGTFEKLSDTLDTEFEKGKKHGIKGLDKDSVKVSLLTIADMFNNKMYLLQQQGSITKEQKDEAIDEFNKSFNGALREYGINELGKEDIDKTQQSMWSSYNRLVKEEKSKSFMGQLESQVNFVPTNESYNLDGQSVSREGIEEI